MPGATAATKPSLLLRERIPGLLTNGRMPPNLRDAARDTVDNRSGVGLYILTGGTMAYTRQGGVKIIPPPAAGYCPTSRIRV
ncbi:MAG: hypothetical protein IJ654_06960 [Bacteroidales bacterium]|nr:hypothetical protein [Bacteroidales bacterium]